MGLAVPESGVGEVLLAILLRVIGEEGWLGFVVADNQ